MMKFASGEKPQYLGLVLLAVFSGFLGWYFCATYLGRQKSWRVQERMLTGHDDFFAVDVALDGKVAAVGRFGRILLSRDRAKTWQERPSLTSRALTAISFADPEHAFVVGSGGTILATRDGGNGWSRQSSGTKEHLLGVHASSPMSAHVVGAFGIFLSTADGGATWEKHELAWDRLIPLITKESGILEPNLNGVHFINAETGWIAGEFGLILKTTDGGRTWSTQTYGADRPQLYAVEFHGSRVGWSVGQQGAVFTTADGGAHWVAVDIGTRKNLYGIAVEGKWGVIVGEGIVLATQDAGFSWKKLESFPRDRWLSGVSINERRAVVAGQGGTIRALDLADSIVQREAAAR